MVGGNQQCFLSEWFCEGSPKVIFKSLVVTDGKLYPLSIGVCMLVHNRVVICLSTYSNLGGIAEVIVAFVPYTWGKGFFIFIEIFILCYGV